MRTRTIAIAILAVLVQSLGSVTPARAVDPVTVEFAFTGSDQIFDVPDGVTEIRVELVGAKGATELTGGGGGLGADVAGDLAVAPGQRLYILVGGNGGPAFVGLNGGFNGGAPGGLSQPSLAAGGGGGGGSDIRAVASESPGTLESRLMVAGGGGGSGTASSAGGGAGGNAGAAGLGAADGNGGGGGLAGTSTAGGAGGVGIGVPNGATGSLAVGGAGSGTSGNFGGGGGGGGYYGGGGGGGAISSLATGGGGGGSSFTGAATNASVAGDSTGVPSVSITYGGDGGGGSGSDTGAVDAVVTMATSAACLELSTQGIDFGIRRFGQIRQAGSPSIEVTNCSAIPGLILARGTDATGEGPSFWSLVDTGGCEVGTLGTDKYEMLLEDTTTGIGTFLTTTNTELEALDSDEGAEYIAFLNTPCPGSTGSGVVMGMQILFTAVEE
jgi:hypothetical protein